MNPAALKEGARGPEAQRGDHRQPRRVQPAEPDQGRLRGEPLEDHSLDKYRVFRAQIGTMNRRALEGSGLDNKSQERCKELLRPGMVYWLFSRPLEPTIEYLKKTFAKKPELADANIKVPESGLELL